MNTLISLILAFIFVIACKESLRRHPVPYYIGATAISVAVFIIQLTSLSVYFPAFINTWVWPVFFRGGLAGALFTTVMWAGALPIKSKRIKHLLPIRGELSIIASILTLGHNASNGLTYFKYLFTEPSKLPVPTLLAAICSLIMILIMLPLFITSFKKIRRKMKSSSWKKLQRLAYVFYGLLFVHLSLLYVPFLLASRNYWLTYIIYCLIYIPYAICRVFKAILKNANVKMLKIQIAGNVIAVIITVLICLLIATNVNASAKVRPEASGSAAEASAETETEMASDPATELSSEQTDETKGETSTEEITETTSETSPYEITDASENDTPSEKKYNDGIYTGTGNGYEGPITVNVTIENGLIVWIDVVESIEDPEFFSPAFKVLEEVVNNQHTNIDAVSGSTYSSWGLLDAVDDALAKAR